MECRSFRSPILSHRRDMKLSTGGHFNVKVHTCQLEKGYLRLYSYLSQIFGDGASQSSNPGSKESQFMNLANLRRMYSYLCTAITNFYSS